MTSAKCGLDSEGLSNHFLMIKICYPTDRIYSLDNDRDGILESLDPAEKAKF